jgi:hypothetical protein
VFSGGVNFGGANLAAVSSADIFLAKLTGSSGSHVWSKQFGTTGYNSPYDVAVDSSNNIALAGAFASAINFGLSPDTVITSTGPRDIFLAKFSPTGANTFSQAYGDDSLNTKVIAVAIDAMGNMIMTGTFDGSMTFPGLPTLTATGTTEDFWLAKLSPVGTPLWSKSFGGMSSDDFIDAAVDGSGNIVLTGRLESTVNFGGAALEALDPSGDVFLAKLNSTGDHLWSHQYGDTQGQGGMNLAVHLSSGEIAMVGTNSGTIQFGETTLTSMGGGDMFVARFAP